MKWDQRGQTSQASHSTRWNWIPVSLKFSIEGVVLVLHAPGWQRKTKHHSERQYSCSHVQKSNKHEIYLHSKKSNSIINIAVIITLKWWFDWNSGRLHNTYLNSLSLCKYSTLVKMNHVGSHPVIGQTLQFLLKPRMVFISSSLNTKSNTCMVQKDNYPKATRVN